MNSKADKFLKSSLDLIPSPSPSVKIQIMCGKVYLMCKGKNFVDNTQQCFAFTPQANFPAHNLNFHWRWGWWDWIQVTFKNLLYFIDNDETADESPQAKSGHHPHFDRAVMRSRRKSVSFAVYKVNADTMQFDIEHKSVLLGNLSGRVRLAFDSWGLHTMPVLS